MQDTYKGESPTKKLARVFIWEMIGRYHPRSLNEAGNFLVLGSREGGDVAFLIGTGCDPKRIFAADTDADACAILRARFPGVNVLHGDIAEICKDNRLPKFDVIFLDFCGPVTPRTLRTFHLALLRKMTENGTAVIGVMRGRELALDIRQTIETERAHCEEAVKSGERAPEMPDNTRGAAIDKWLLDTVRQCGYPYIPMVCGVLHYHSRSAKQGGVPMYMRVFRVKRNILRSGASSFLRSADREWQVLKEKSAVTSGVEVHVIENQDDDTKVRGILLELARDLPAVKSPELLLNVTKGTLAAWKAHSARGTYANETPPEPHLRQFPR
jgi:hypothetical protein